MLKEQKKYSRECNVMVKGERFSERREVGKE
jgi:hypothetical protein